MKHKQQDRHNITIPLPHTCSSATHISAIWRPNYEGGVWMDAIKQVSQNPIQPAHGFSPRPAQPPPEICRLRPAPQSETMPIAGRLFATALDILSRPSAPSQPLPQACTRAHGAERSLFANWNPEAECG